MGERHLVDEGLLRVSLHVAEAVSASFVRAGQFHRIRERGAAASMFAIASPPGSREFDYLIRRGAGVSEVLASAAEGTTLEVSTAEGSGFPLERAIGCDLLLVCTGTALAPIRSVLGAVAPRRSDFQRVTLVQGQRSPKQLPWLDELEALPDVEVRTVVTEGGPTWRGPVGLVQQLVPGVVTQNTVAFLVGQSAMTTEVTALLTERGVPASRVFLNV